MRAEPMTLSLPLPLVDQGTAEVLGQTLQEQADGISASHEAARRRALSWEVALGKMREACQHKSAHGIG